MPYIQVTLWQHNNDDNDSAIVAKIVYFYSQHRALHHCSMPEYIRHYAHERYRQSMYNPKATLEGVDVVISSFGNSDEDSLVANRDHSSPFCYDDGGRVMCTMPYLICLCSDVFSDLSSSNVSIPTYAGLYCYIDPYDSVRYHPKSLDDCFLLLAESNGYTL